jgi:hypothetical protein
VLKLLLDAMLPKLGLRECVFSLLLDLAGGGRLLLGARTELCLLLETDGAGAASYELAVVGLRLGDVAKLSKLNWERSGPSNRPDDLITGIEPAWSTASLPDPSLSSDA